MFTINAYQISFQKFHSLILSKNKGRFDTACKIEGKHSEQISTGLAYLNPKDSPDKITGKKVALTKALANMGATKPLRTEIWKAFWNWVESWKTYERPGCFGEPTQESKLCNNCSYLNHCVDKLWETESPDSST